MSVFLVSGHTSLLEAQGRELEGKNVAVIQFVPVQQPLEPAQINRILPLRMNTPLNMEVVRASIQRLYATGRFEDIQVDAEPLGEGVIVRFYTKPRWFIGHVAATGDISNPPNAGQLANATRLELGLPLTEDKVQEATASLKKLLNNNGLFESTVQPVYEYDPVGQQAHIRFVINSGRRARYTTPALNGELKMEPEKIVSATGWKRWLIGGWKPVTQMRTLNGLDHIRTRYERASRLQAKVGLDSLEYDSDSNRARPVLEINAGPKIQIRTIGADVSQKTLRRLIPVYEEHAVDHDLLVEGQRNLRNYFQSEGYFEAEVEFKEQRIANDQATIDYLINQGRRHKLVHIGILGNRYFPSEAIRERLYLQTASLLGFRRGRFSEGYLREDEQSIANLYRSNGFRDVSVTSKIVDDYQGRRGEVAVFISIIEGPQWFVAGLTLEGVDHLDKTRLLSMLSSVEGQPFSEFNVAVDRDTILDEYFSNGFPNARFEWSSTPAREPHQVNLRFKITEGEQIFVRQVLINGLKTTRAEVVDRNLGLNPGDPLSPTRMRETQRRLYDLGVFAKVDTAVQNPDGDTQQKFVVYDMDEARRFSLATGFGAEIARIGGTPNSLEAPGGQAGFAPRVSFDLTRLNLWGVGHSLSFRSRVSTLEKRGLVNYLAPRYRNREGLQLSFTGLYEDTRNVRTFSAKRYEGSAQLSQRYSKATTLFYRYTYRRVSTSDLKVTPFIIPLVAQPVRVGMLSGSVLQDRRDDPVESRRGIYNTLDLGLAARAFGSQRNFVRFLGRNATYHPVGRRYVLARSTSFGIIQPFHATGSELEAIPLPERFFAGGSNSHRGFPENQAGPRDPTTGFPLGGNALFMNQTELRFPLIGANIGGVLFHDAGNVYSRVGNISFRVTQPMIPVVPLNGSASNINPSAFDYMVHAVGMGVRYHTPIGPVRVDLAYSINPPTFFGFKGTIDDLLNAGVNPCKTLPDKCTLQNISHFQFFFSIGQTF